ncbi:MAG: [FeFe] hydrogenase, group A [Fibrobacterales bacterium]
MSNKGFVTVDTLKVPIDNERNVLEIIRKGNVDLPTFCYHSELSIYGACRLCVVELNGQSVQASCSIAPKDGMVVKTNTAELREMRKISLELLLANHDNNCTSCSKNSDCKLREISAKVGVESIRYKQNTPKHPIDDSAPVTRNPNKCILCGDCVRYCKEVQGIGAIDFAYRGSECVVQPVFGKKMSEVECVYCGQCARVCPTDGINIKSQNNDVWNTLSDGSKTVYAHIAPAVRAAFGEMFNLGPQDDIVGRIVTGLRMLGFDKVYDTSFGADMTVWEEGTECISRIENDGVLPIMTSCCPAWVKYVEHNYHEVLPNLSSCKSPQGMMSSMIKEYHNKEDSIARKDMVTVAIMPCSAKKFEADRPELSKDGFQDTDYVVTTKELGDMFKQAGIDCASLTPSSIDLPLGFKTGGAVLFGNSGGVSEAVLRYVQEKLTGKTNEQIVFDEVRGNEGLREASITIGSNEIRLAIVHGLGNAKKVCEEIKAGESPYHIVEVMSCPNGCVGGAGQPVPESLDHIIKRKDALYNADATSQLHKPQENMYAASLYEKHVGSIGGHAAHDIFHTTYTPREI